MSIYKKRNKYWVDIRHNRERYRRPSPDNSYSGAKAYEAMLRQKLARGEDVIEEKEIKKEIPSFEEFVDKWYKTYVVINNKASEQKQKDLMIKVHLKPFFKQTPLDKITTIMIEEFKSKKQKYGLANKSINNLLGILGKCLRTAQDWEIIEKLPKIKPLKNSMKEIKYLNENDYNKLLEVAKDKGIIYEMILFSLRAGVRVGELIALDWKDIDFEKRMVVIQRNYVDGILGTPKNHKFRAIYLAQDIYDILLSRRKKEGIVFPDKDGNYYSRFSCRRRLNTLCKKAQIEQVNWHALRHSFASQLVTNGISLKAIQELLGHSDLKMVQRYAHLESSTLRDAIETLEPKKETIHFNFGHHMDTISEKKEKKRRDFRY